MDHGSSVLALAGALLLAGGGGSRLDNVTTGGFAERSAASTWSRSLRSTEQTPDPRAVLTTQGSAADRVRATAAATATPSTAHPAGRFSLLTYNVAGLPGLVSGSDPAVNSSIISQLLNHYDVALVQEDFSYHTQLSSRARHSYRSEPMHSSLALMPDGLNWFSRHAFGWVHRVRWAQCNGYLGSASDCLADKGFSYAELTLAPGITVDAYNLHAEAGRAPMDVEVRRANFEQLAEYIRTRSQNRAVIVAGDTNLRLSVPRDGETLDRFLEGTGLSDACRRFGCGDERLDRVLVRSSQELELDILGWWTDRRFVDVDGAPLSDHLAVGVELGWRKHQSLDLVAER